MKKARKWLRKYRHLTPTLNGVKLFSKKGAKKIFHFIYFMIIIMTIVNGAKDVIDNIYGDKLATIFQIANNYLSANTYYNILLGSLVIVCAYYWLMHIYKDQFLSLQRVGGAIIIISILGLRTRYCDIETIFGIDYLRIIVWGLFAGIELDIMKLWHVNWLSKIRERKRTAYITDLPSENLDQKVRGKYAASVAKWLMQTDVSKTSFAVGITSEWGTGKTSFLYDLKKELKNQCYFMEFKPWNCSKPEQIVMEYFEELRKAICPIYSPLQRPIIRYARLLTDMEFPSWVKIVSNFLPSMEHNIDSYKQNIKKGLSQLDKPILVCIDDIDRLAANELFEVLRLIRNTADFENMFYVACYDKNYVIKQISNKGIEDSELYLEKIFPLELTLPKVEDENLVETLRRALIDMNYQQRAPERLFNKIGPVEKDIIIHSLPTFRKVKRFARTLVTNTEFLTQQTDNKIDLYELFLLELIHFCMPKLYTILRDNPQELLDINRDERNKIARYELKSNITELTGKALSKQGNDLLRLLMSSPKDDKVHHLSVVDSYPNYFCFAVPSSIISQDEFDEMVKDKSSKKQKIHKWFWKRPLKRNSSLFTRFMSVRTKEIEHDDWKNYFDALIYWICEGEFELIHLVMEKFLNKNNYKNDVINNQQELAEYFKKRYNRALTPENCQHNSIAQTLSYFYENMKQNQTDYILNGDDVMEMIKNNFNTWVGKNNAWDAINVIALDGNELNKHIKSYCVKNTIINNFGDSIITYNNVIITYVIKYFTNKKSSHIKDAKEIYDDNDNRYKNPIYVTDKDLKEEKKLIFGDEELYNQYIEFCFYQEPTK